MRVAKQPAIEARLVEMGATLDALRARKVELEREVRLAAASGDDAAGDVLTLLADFRAGGGDTVTRLNAALSRLMVDVTIGHGQEAKKWIEAGVDMTSRHKPEAFPAALMAGDYARIMDGARVSIVVRFRATGNIS